MDLLVYGSREFGQVVRLLAKACGHEVIGFIDDLHPGEGVIGGYDTVRARHPPGTAGIALAIGYRHLEARWRVYERLSADGYATPPLVHGRALVEDPGAIGPGAMVMAGAIVDAGARLGAVSVVWPGAVINHHSQVGNNSFIAPNATVCGYSQVGAHCFVGAGAVIVDHRSLPDGGFVKAGDVFH
jgi:acetyltransferase-like isoleucine patch superfamily enzyme